ncbi:MAG: HAD family hydrolase [Candidatus Omnitrophota bacterium]
MPINALLFDLDQTLGRDRDSYLISLERIMPVCRQRHPELSADTFRETFIRINNWHWEHYDDSPIRSMIDPAEVRFHIFGEIFSAFHLLLEPDFLRAIAKEFQKARVETYRCYDEALGVLETLHGRIPLAIVTNGNTIMQKQKIKACGLEPYLSAVFIAQEAGISKPAPEIFLKALAAVNAKPHEAMMVGDNPEKDILGAKAAGIKTAWIPRRNGYADPQPDYRLTNLKDLLPIVEKENGRIPSLST